MTDPTDIANRFSRFQLGVSRARTVRLRSELPFLVYHPPPCREGGPSEPSMCDVAVGVRRRTLRLHSGRPVGPLKRDSWLPRLVSFEFEERQSDYLYLVSERTVRPEEAPVYYTQY
jgi:hypothetical protein